MNTIIQYTWPALTADVNRIANWYKNTQTPNTPDLIVGIMRSGMVPAIMLSHILGAPVKALEWSLRDGKIKDKRSLDHIAVQATQGKRVLIIDGIIDSGATIREIKERSFDTEESILYASLYFNISQTETVDFSPNLIDRNKDKRWIVFPYESIR